MTNRQHERRVHRIQLAWLIALAGLFAWAYFPALREVVSTWAANPDYNHGYVVVPLAVVILWTRRAVRPSMRAGPHWAALTLLVMAGALRLAAGRLFLPQLDAWSIPLWIGGIVWLAAGWRMLRWASPAIAFLWFAAPLPGTVEVALSTPLQFFAASTSTAALQLLGQPAIAEGTTILLGNDVLEVERACSGLRMFYGMIALSVGCIALARPAWWKSVLLLIAAVPVAIAANTIRIVVTAYLVRHAGEKVATTFSHDLAGLLMIPVAVVGFVVLLWLMKKLQSEYQASPTRGQAWSLGIVVGVALLAVVSVVLIRHQRDRTFQTLYETAQRHRQQGASGQAIDYLQRYLVAKPEDFEALVVLASWYEESARSRGQALRALELYRLAWQREPEDLELALSAARLALDAGDFRTAISICDDAMSPRLGEPIRRDFTEQRADALVGFLDWENRTAEYTEADAVEALRAAVGDGTQYRRRHAVELARLLRFGTAMADSDRAESEDLMRRLVEDHADDPLAWLERYRYRRDVRLARGERAEQASPGEVADLTNAIELADGAPADVAWQVYDEAANHFVQQGDRSRAEDLYERAIEVQPDNPRAYRRLAELWNQPGDGAGRRRAADLLVEGLRNTNEPEADLLLALPLVSLLADLGDYEAAQRHVEAYANQMQALTEPRRSLVALSLAVVRAEIEASRRGPLAAARMLVERLEQLDMASLRTANPVLLAQAMDWLAEQHAAAGLADLALANQIEAVDLWDGLPAGRIDLAQYAVSAGNLDMAENVYRQWATDSPEAWEPRLALAEILLRQQANQSLEQRSFASIDRLLSQVARLGADPSAIALATAERQYLADNRDAAAELLRRACEDDPQNAQLFRRLALTEAGRGDFDAARAAATQYAALVDSSEAAILEAQLLMAVDDPQQALAALSSESTPAGAAAEPVVLARVQVLRRQGAAEQAIAELSAYIEQNPQSLRANSALADLARGAGDWQLMRECEDRLRQAEGPQGSQWRWYRATRLMATSAPNDTAPLVEVERLVDELRRLRPLWPRTYLAEAELALRQDDMLVAIGSLERTWELGGRNLLVAQQLLDLLTQAGQYEDAMRFVDRVRAFVKESPSLFDSAVPYLTQDNDTAETVAIAEEFVANSPDDPHAHLRLGRVLSLLAEGRASAEARREWMRTAEQAYQEAIRLDQQAVQPWAELVLFYSRHQSSARKVPLALDAIEQRVPMPRADKALLLSRLSRLAGLMPRARQYAAQAVRFATAELEGRDQGDVLATLSEFYLASEPWLAEHLARQALELDPEHVAASRALVRALTLRNEPSSIGEAQQIVSHWGEAASLNRSDRYVVAYLLSHTDQPNELSRAIDLVHRADRMDRTEQHLLAMLHLKTDRVATAYRLLDQLASDPEATATEIRDYLIFWQDQFLAQAGPDEQIDFAADARQAEHRLLSMSGNEHVWLELKLREVRIAEGDEAPSEAAVGRVIDELFASAPVVQRSTPDYNAGLLHRIVQQLLAAGQGRVAIAAVRDPVTDLPRQQAIGIFCDAVKQVASRGTTVQPSVWQALVDWRDAEGTSMALQRAIGEAQIIGGQWEEAERTYKQALRQEPNDVSALNNLAAVMAERPDGLPTARRLIDRALQRAPNRVDLRDTRAMILLDSGDVRQARSRLQQLTTQEPHHPILWLHLSMAEDTAGNGPAAQQALVQAIGLGALQQALPPAERAYVREIQATMDSQQ